MRILEVIPKEIDVIFSIPLSEIENLKIAIDCGEFDLDKKIPEESEAFTSMLKFHELLKVLLKDIKK